MNCHVTSWHAHFNPIEDSLHMQKGVPASLTRAHLIGGFCSAPGE